MKNKTINVLVNYHPQTPHVCNFFFYDVVPKVDFYNKATGEE